MHRFKDLEIWKQSRIFCKDIYEISSVFPDAEKFGLTSQLQRACISIPSNIAEGASRNSNRDFSRFLEIALGSCYERETQLILANDLGFLSEEQFQDLQPRLLSIIKMISKLRSTLKIQ